MNDVKAKKTTAPATYIMPYIGHPARLCENDKYYKCVGENDYDCLTCGYCNTDHKYYCNYCNRKHDVGGLYATTSICGGNILKQLHRSGEITIIRAFCHDNEEHIYHVLAKRNDKKIYFTIEDTPYNPPFQYPKYVKKQPNSFTWDDFYRNFKFHEISEFGKQCRPREPWLKLNESIMDWIKKSK